MPDASVDVSKLVPAFVVVMPSIVQSTLMTAGSTTFTLSTPAPDTAAGLMVVPAMGSVESIGFTARQIVKMICSRETELKLVFTASPNRLFIIEFEEGRYWPVST